MQKVRSFLTLFILVLSITMMSNAQTTETALNPDYEVQQLPETPGDGNYTIPTPVNVTLGSPVSISGNESIELVTPSGISVKVLPSSGVEITIDLLDGNPFGTIPQGLTSLGIYLAIEMNDTTVDVDSTIAIPYNDSMIEGVNESTLELRFYNETTGTWEAVPSWVDLENKVVYGNTTHFSTWTATGEESTSQVPPPSPRPPINNSRIPVNVTLGNPVSVRGNESVQLVTPSGIYVNVTPSEGVEITIEMNSTNPYRDVPEGLASVGIYLSIEMNDTTVDVNATIAIPYNDSMIEGINESALELRFYNETTGTWDAVPSWVDLENKVIYGNTTHFSTWTATGEEEITPDQSTTPPVSQGPPVAKPGAPFEVTPGSPVAVQPGKKVDLVTPSGITVSVTPAEGVEITIEEYTDNPKGALPTGKNSLGIYLSIEMNETVGVEATLSLPYEADSVASMRVESLTFMFFNEETSQWEAVPSWIENNMIYANTTHFSTWTVTGELAEETSTDTDTVQSPLLIEFFGLGLFVLSTSYYRRRK